MARIKVKAKVTGTHAMSGLYIETGKEYEVEEEHFGDEVFEKIQDPRIQAGSLSQRDGSSNSKKKKEE